LAFLFRGQQRWPEMYKWKENKEKMSFISKMSGYDTVIDCTDQTEFQYCLTSKPVSDGGGIFGKSLELSLKQKSMNKFEISIPTDSTLDLLNRATLSQIEEYISRVLDTGTLNTSQKDIEDIKISIDEIKKELVNDVHEKSRMEAIFKNLRAIKGTAEFANAVVTLYQFILSVIK